MTRDEWIKRYAVRMVRLGSWMTHDQAIASAERGADDTEATGNMNPDDWESPESVAEEYFASE